MKTKCHAKLLSGIDCSVCGKKLSAHHSDGIDTLEAENERLRKIISKELLENDELGSEFVYVNELKREIDRLNSHVIELLKRKCSHGDYRMEGTTDCRTNSCSGRTEFYVIGECLCIECRHKKEQS